MGSESENNDMEEAGGRESEENRVKDRGSCRSNEIEGRCESNRGGDEVYPTTFGNEEKTGLKLDRRSVCLIFFQGSVYFAPNGKILIGLRLYA